VSIFNDEVADRKAQIAPAKGAYGRRHHSRGLKGFHDPKAAGKRQHRPAEELMGERLLDALLEAGHTEEAEKIFQQLLAKG
jgi:pentatricopeptide repeat protein